MMIKLKTAVLNTNLGQNGCCILINNFPFSEADSIEFLDISLPYTQYLNDYNFLFRQNLGSNVLGAYVEPRRTPEYVYHNSIGENHFYSGTPISDGTIKFNTDGSVLINGAEVKAADGNVWKIFGSSTFRIFTDEYNRFLSNATVGEIKFYSNGNTVMDLCPYYDDVNQEVIYVDVLNNLEYHNTGTGTIESGQVASTIIVETDNTKIDSTEQVVNITVASESDWTASTSASYVTFVSGITSGTSADTSISINIQPNSGTTKREFTINFVNATGDTAQLDMLQGYPINKFIFADWIEADATLGSSWIDTGIYPDINTEIEAVVANMKNDATVSNRPIIGNNESQGMSLRDRLSEYLMGDFGDVEEQGWYNELPMPYMEERHILFNSTGLTVSTGETEFYKHYTATSMTGTSTTIHINGHSGVNGTNSYRYGEVIIRKNGTEVWHGIPCVYGNKVGMFDLVSSYFFEGQGTRPFQAIDQSGYITFGTDDFENLMIGDEKVKRVYMGNKIFYVESPFVGLKVSNGVVGMDSGSSSTIKVKSSEPWTLSVDSAATWLNVSPLSGNAGETTVTLTATEKNNTGIARTTTLSATSSSFSATCEVQQAAIHYVNYIYRSTLRNDANDAYIDTGIYPTTATTFRVQGMGKGYTQGNVIVGYYYNDDDKDYRIFWYGGSQKLTFDFNNNRLENDNWGRPTDGRIIDLVCRNYGVISADSTTYLTGNTQTTVADPHTILVDVGTWWLKSLVIWDNDVIVFNGQAAVDSQNNIVGIYDSVSNTWHYNSALTMNYQEIPDSISATSVQNGNDVEFDGWFTSAIYDSIWVSYISNQEYDDAINNNEDPDDLDWVISRGYECPNVTSNTFNDLYTDIICDGWLKAYFFLYNSSTDTVSKTTYWTQTVYGNGDCGEGEMCQEWQVCSCCDGAGTIWDEELQEDVMCECCGGMGGYNMEVPCP